MEVDDPCHWSIDRVVKELCTADRSWKLPAFSSFPQSEELEVLESILREQKVTGSILLLQINDYTLRFDFNFRTLGQRAFIWSAINELRLQSAQYKAYVSRHSNGSVPPSLQSPDIGDQITHGESIISDESSNKRRKLDLTNAPNDRPGDIEHGSPKQASKPDFGQPSQAQDSTHQFLPTPVAEPAIIHPAGSNEKKRKRIAPTLISSDVNPTRDRQIATEADSVLHNNPENIEPGVPFITDDGKKRLVPIHQASFDSEAPYNYDCLLQKPRLSVSSALDEISYPASGTGKLNRKRNEAPKRSRATLTTSYLGKQKITVDDIFYEGTAIGQELPDTESASELSLCLKKLPSGRRLYVHRAMKGYLRSEPKSFKRDGNLYYGICPYPSRLAPKFQSPSFTLFYTNDDGKVHTRREELLRWPEIDPDTSLQFPRASGEDNRVNVDSGILDGLSSHAETFDPDCLVKYQYIQGGDEILPIYGESDEENEYDIDTWAEMEEERGTMEKLMMTLKKPILAIEDINIAIDEGISELVTKWQKEKLPKMRQKAFRIWIKFHKNREARRHHIQGIQKLLDRINDDRLPKLRKEIAGEHWTSQSQVRKQTRIMEQSIYDRESSSWEIDMLRGTTPPEKPLPKASASISSMNMRRTQDYEEGESLESNSKSSSSDEDMDDFIVEDTQSAAEEIEMNLADTEDEVDASMSDSSSWTSNKEPKIQQPSKRLLTARVGSDDHIDFDELDDKPESTRVIDCKVATHPVPTATTSQSVKGEPTLPDLFPASPNNANNPIDLTMLSSDDGPNTPLINLVTPRKKPMLKLIHKGSPFGEGTIAISDEELLLPDIDDLPPYDDLDAIAKFSCEAWTKVSDRERLLILVVNGLGNDLKTAIFAFVASVSEDELWNHMLDVIEALLKAENNLKGVDDATFQTLVAFIRLFNIYARCKYHPRDQPPHALLRKLPDKRAKWFSRFFIHCQKLEDYLSQSTLMFQRGNEDNGDFDDDSDDVIKPGARRRRAVNTTSDDDDGQDHSSQHRKRKRKIYEDKEARDMRENDRQRLEAQEVRRKKLQKKLPSLEYAEGHHKIIINDGKYEHQGFVYVSKEIAPLIKQHQIEGVRFMWSQIITDAKKMQGCLLAHTMGLGKTMQVITLLCAIAEASKSRDESVFSQVPLSLRTSKTLVLCPAGLIDNWMDELLTWAPKGLLGGFRRVDTIMKLPERLQTISDWFHDGGVLILGYEMFRTLYENKKTPKREARLSEETHNTLKDQLLDGPNLIVADEAHKMKNSNSGLAQSTAQFRSKSRIALTGSPLANNVAEYHTMIDWVAPNYLGPAVEFRAKYVEPIQEGLWHDSTASDRRKSLKMLGVLKQDLAPKVHRADMSVLRNELPPKKEFVITVPLTELQKKVYTLYVQSMVSGYTHMTKTGDFSQTTIWHWLAILSLLCNHPDCFNKKLNERKEDARKEQGTPKPVPASRSGTDQEDCIATDLNTPIWKVGVSQELVNKVTELFKEETTDLKAIDLSNKVKILCQILDASRAAEDKVLVFSQSLPTLDFLQELCVTQGRQFFRLDGSTPITKRQEATKAFNVDSTQIYLISTAAGGLGLNIFGANRVVIFDFKFNPIMEEQAVGRAYRIGQQKPVFVYRFVAGGTFEDSVHNKAVFKTQLASRVVDKKSPVAWARKRLGDMLFEPKDVEQSDLSEFVGMDPLILDPILSSQASTSTIRGIVQSDTFEQDDDDKLTADEEREVKQLLHDEKLKRSNPKAFYELIQKRNFEDRNRQMGLSAQMSNLGAYNGGTQKFSMRGAYPASPTALPQTSIGSIPLRDKPLIVSTPSSRQIYGTTNMTLTSVKSPLSAPSNRMATNLTSDRTQIKSPLGALRDTTGKPPSSLLASVPYSPVRPAIQSTARDGIAEPSLTTDVPQHTSTTSPLLTKPTSPVPVDNRPIDSIETASIIKSVSKTGSSSDSKHEGIKQVCFQDQSSSKVTPFHSNLLSGPSEMVVGAKELQVIQPGQKSSGLPPRSDQEFYLRANPKNFHMLSDEELEEFLRSHDLNDDGNRPELVARCVAKQAAIDSNGVGSRPISTPSMSHQTSPLQSTSSDGNVPSSLGPHTNHA